MNLMGGSMLWLRPEPPHAAALGPDAPACHAGSQPWRTVGANCTEDAAPAHGRLRASRVASRRGRSTAGETRQLGHNRPNEGKRDQRAELRRLLAMIQEGTIQGSILTTF